MDFAQFLRTQFEPLQYLAFFGSLLALGLAEAVIPQEIPRPRGKRAGFQIFCLRHSISRLSAQFR